MEVLDYAEVNRLRQEENDEAIKNKHYLYWDGKRFLHDRAAKTISQLHTYQARELDQTLWIYDEKRKHYTRDETKYKTLTHKLAGQSVTESQLQNVRTSLLHSRYNPDFNPTTHIPLLNGHLNLTTLEIEPADPKRFYTYTVQVEYQPNADCPLIRKFLSEILPEDSIKTYVEFLAYTLFERTNKLQAALMMNGCGANGKSVALEIVKAMLKESYAAMSLQELCENRYAPAFLFDKIVNLGPDMPSRPIEVTSIFKAITGGDTVTIDVKYRDPVQSEVGCKLWFACNELPRSYDDTDGYYRRWVLLDFPVVIPREQRDPDLARKLTTKEEMSGLFNWCLVAYQELLERGFFLGPSGSELRALYRVKSNPVFAWLSECVELDSQGEYSKEEAYYDSYVPFCSLRGLPVRDLAVWMKELVKETNGSVFASRPRVGGERIHVLRGVKMVLTREDLKKKLETGLTTQTKKESGQGGQGGQASCRPLRVRARAQKVEKCPDHPDSPDQTSNDEEMVENAMNLKTYTLEFFETDVPMNRQRAEFEIAQANNVPKDEVTALISRLLEQGELAQHKAGFLKRKTNH